MESPKPEWLCNDFFTQCLQNEKNNHNIVVTKFTTSPAAPPGNNYASFIIRVKVEYKDETSLYSTSLIVKSEQIEGQVNDLFDISLAVEPIFYYKFIPRANKITNVSFAPRNLFSPRQDVIIMEDLKETGFIMIDRTKQLDFDHCRLYMIAAASFHAVSFALHKEDPEFIETIGKPDAFSAESKSSATFRMMIKGGMASLIDATEKIDKYQKYVQLLKDITPVLWDMIVDARTPNNELVKVITQGDPTPTNMMFKYGEDGIVSEVKLIDFQGLSFGTPVHDVLFFLWAGANNDVKRNKLEDLYTIYVDSFNNKLQELKCSEEINYQQFKKNIERFSPFSLMMAVTFVPFIVYPGAIDFSTFMSKEDEYKNPFENCYTEDFCKNILPQLLEALEISGIFKYLESMKSNYIK